MRVTIYVEGGGDRDDVKTRCRKGFRLFLEREGFRGRMPAIVACGNRHEAVNKFKHAIFKAGDGEFPILLVDSEAPIRPEHQGKPWAHLESIPGPDRLSRPEGASEDHAHLMVQCMESWFLADRERLASFFGQNFQTTTLPGVGEIESFEKRRVIAGIEQAARKCAKRGYDKGEHSFEILAVIDPAKVEKASTHAERLFTLLRAKDGGR